ncbi:hypothetical protein DITRI_Ditri06bG0158100 [Diplodiscus trichospermus]
MEELVLYSSTNCIAALEVLCDWIRARNKDSHWSQPSHTAGPCLRWHKLPNSFLKCNSDAAIFNDTYSSGLCSVFCDANGAFVTCCVLVLGVVDDVNSPVKDITKFGSIVSCCRSFLSLEKSFLDSFVKRQANDAAHALAREAHFMLVLIFILICRVA